MAASPANIQEVLCKACNQPILDGELVNDYWDGVAMKHIVCPVPPTNYPAREGQTMNHRVPVFSPDDFSGELTYWKAQNILREIRETLAPLGFVMVGGTEGLNIITPAEVRYVPEKVAATGATV
jgi:hypothetical protein